jgi:tetratricopeptide (TPR) repeat protein
MKRAQLVSPGSIARMLNASGEAWERKDFKQSIEILERASRLDPANAQVLLGLGRAYGLRYDYAGAERCFEKAIRVAVKKTEALEMAAHACTDFVNPQMAEGYFERAVKQNDASPELFARMAELYEHLARVDEARALVDRALQLDARCAPALLVRARLDRQAGRLEDAERTLQSFPANAERHMRAGGYYELGMVLDRLGRYDEAMTAFLEAKAMLRPDAAPFLARLQKERPVIRERQAGFTAEAFQRWFDFGAQLQPARRLAFLGGHPRSGTTLLEQLLDSHPDIVSAEETQVFVNDAFKPLSPGCPEGSSMLTILESAQANALQQSRANYFQSMDLLQGIPVGDRLLIDKNPALTLFIPACIRVFPEIKILVALRDPRDLVLSCFMQTYVPITLDSASYLSFEDTIDGYTLMMGGWQKFAPLIKNPWLEVKYEDTVEDLESVSRRVLDFLGVPWDARVLAFHEHARQKRVRSPSYADVTKPVFKRAVGRWRNYQKYLEPHLEKLEPFVKAFGYC